MKKFLTFSTLSLAAVLFAGCSSQTAYAPTSSPMASATTSQTEMVPMTPVPQETTAVIMTKTSPTKGDYLSDTVGKTLYIFDKDTKGVSNCTGGCATLWPPYLSTATNTPATLPANVSIIKRADGTMQFAWKGMPLYYYAPDKNVGDTTGDGVGGTWHLVK